MRNLDLISKKELLEVTGISYGQLYRWKREKLIPEEWFIKQSSYTGQETFFPKEQIINRVNSIMKLKDDCSHEEIAKILAPEMSANISKKDLMKIEDLNKNVLDVIFSYDEEEKFTLFEVAFITWINDLIKDDTQMKNIIENSLDFMKTQGNQNLFCTLFEIENNFYTAFHKDIFISFCSNVKVIGTVSLNEIANNLKVKYKNILN
ncbi:MAG: DUF4004 family protein [Oscillospiraceae bacterium]|nr:DUF4004 family protein [Oscillospiraceae bacterium]